jgi:DNA adenine methylase
MKYQERFSVNDGVLKAPFPWFGGKSRVAPLVWERFGDVTVYAEPFAGSLAVLLGRPEEHERTIESVNDKDGFVCNAWRSIIHDPEQTAHWADWPSFENDLHARHAWLVERRDSLVERLEGNPDYFDAKIAGWWLWGIANWIGSGWCGGKGPWKRVEVATGDWRLRKVESEGHGVSRRLMEMGSAGRGVNRQLLRMVSAGEGVNRKCQNQSLVEYFDALSARLRNVRVSCGDWSRILTPAALSPGVGGVRGIFLDPPYSADAE